ncbi:hypothetical protein [uncultured Adlercreutzia sp.]|uniref:hypothetical protein n=1 Tax=uncultured Adlercreutzia sp. TaxID=875803 RepID=UPI0026F38FE3|nr:hypothetical protein [uncultured Adlercreutzia sp.]
MLFTIMWLLALIVLLKASIGGDVSSLEFIKYLLLYGLLIFTIAGALIAIFSAIVRGDAPFSEAQADRLRLIAVAAFAFVLAELVFSDSVSAALLPPLGLDMGINDEGSKPIFNLNIGMLVFSAIMYSLSVIFRYAALLQQLSDDTV